MAFEVPAIGEAVTASDPKIKKAIEGLNTLVGAENKVKGAGVEEGTLEGKHVKAETIENSDLKGEITRAKLAAESKPFTWYTTKVIATEQTRENVAFGTLTTADEIKEVVLPENGFILVAYGAAVKSSVAAAGRVAVFLGANQIKVHNGTEPVVQEASTSGTGFNWTYSTGTGLERIGTAAGNNVTTGQILGSNVAGNSGMMFLFAAAGTYNVSVQFKATSGSITAKNRALWVATLGY